MIRSDPPNPLTSTAYAKDFNEVKAIGASTARPAAPMRPTPQSSGKTTPSRYGTASSARSRRSPTRHRCQRPAVATNNLAAADAAIGCWNNKYHWKSWRPITAIREAATDANPATEADPAWTPLFDPTTPEESARPRSSRQAFPDHPAGHGCISGAIVRTLGNVSSVPTRSPSALSATALTSPPEATTDPRSGAQGDDQRARSGAAASTSEPLTSRATALGTGRPLAPPSTTSSQPTTTTTTTDRPHPEARPVSRRLRIDAPRPRDRRPPAMPPTRTEVPIGVDRASVRPAIRVGPAGASRRGWSRGSSRDVAQGGAPRAGRRRAANGCAHHCPAHAHPVSQPFVPLPVETDLVWPRCGGQDGWPTTRRDGTADISSRSTRAGW